MAMCPGQHFTEPCDAPIAARAHQDVTEDPSSRPEITGLRPR